MTMGRLATALLVATAATAAQKVNLREIENAQSQFRTKEHATPSPFLSATLKTVIAPVATYIKPDQTALLSQGLVKFLQHVFDDQQVFDVNVVGVAIFEEELVPLDADRDGKTRRSVQRQGRNDRKLSLNALQKGQFDFERDDDDYRKEVLKNEYTLSFATVVSAEHMEEGQMLSHGEFQAMLIHICHKFDTHLVQYVKDIDKVLDVEYFGNVESVIVSGYEEDWDEEQAEGYNSLSREGEGSGGKSSKLNAASIVGIVFGILLLVPLAFAAVKLRRRQKQMNDNNRWRSQEIASANTGNPHSSIKSLSVLYSKARHNNDDYSFDPLGTDNGYTGHAIPRLYSDSTAATALPVRQDSFDNDLPPSATTIPSSAAPSLFQQLPTTPSSPMVSQERKQHIYAPPGKVGVAIDVHSTTGNPMVHKVKKGSPLEGLLRPNDLVLAIDDVDTTCMSAADVTHLMVKRMNYQRKITFVRKE